jgi:hypothetical protein
MSRPPKLSVLAEAPTFRVEHHPDAFQRPMERDSAYRIPLAMVLAHQTGMSSVEIAKDTMPTIGLHAIRLPSGAATKKLHETANNLYAVVSGLIGTSRQSGAAVCLVGVATGWARVFLGTHFPLGSTLQPRLDNHHHKRIKTVCPTN